MTLAFLVLILLAPDFCAKGNAGNSRPGLAHHEVHFPRHHLSFIQACLHLGLLGCFSPQGSSRTKSCGLSLKPKAREEFCQACVRVLCEASYIDGAGLLKMSAFRESWLCSYQRQGIVGWWQCPWRVACKLHGRTVMFDSIPERHLFSWIMGEQLSCWDFVE